LFQDVGGQQIRGVCQNRFAGKNRARSAAQGEQGRIGLGEIRQRVVEDAGREFMNYAIPVGD